jgi:hypothetical protein
MSAVIDWVKEDWGPKMKWNCSITVEVLEDALEFQTKIKV